MDWAPEVEGQTATAAATAMLRNQVLGERRSIWARAICLVPVRRGRQGSFERRSGARARSLTRALFEGVDARQTVGVPSSAIGRLAIPYAATLTAFRRKRRARAAGSAAVPASGPKEHGQLEPVFLYNGPIWAVWLHYHPDTTLFK